MVVLRYGHCRSADKIENPRKYWNTTKTRKPQLSSICRQLKLKAKDGKLYNTEALSKNMLKWMLRTPLWRATDAALEYGLI